MNKLTAEQVRHAAHGHYELRMMRDVDGFDMPQVAFDWQAIADELNATLGGGECEFVGDAKYPPKCSSCGWQAGIYDCKWLEDGEYEYDGNFCKECGARIRKAVKR